MIENFYLSEWRQQVPWVPDYQVEQDLIITRALISLYANEKIRKNLAFRGGTALNKLFFNPPSRYSEDIDLVQIHPQPIGPIITEIRDALSWLGQPKGKLTPRSAKLIYQYVSNDNIKRKLKIEMNTTEHFNVQDFLDYEFTMNSSWFSGKSTITTYSLNELMATKLRALYQRSKGRDLYDMWIVLKNELVDCQAVVEIFEKYCENEKIKITRADFERNLSDKKQNLDFRNDILNLITDHSMWLVDEAFNITHEKLISLLPGKSLKIKK